MATHSSVLAWRIPGMAEPGGLLSQQQQTPGGVAQSRTRLKRFSSSSSSGEKPSFAEFNEGTFRLYGGGEKLLSWEMGGGVFFSGY